MKVIDEVQALTIEVTDELAEQLERILERAEALGLRSISTGSLETSRHKTAAPMDWRDAEDGEA